MMHFSIDSGYSRKNQRYDWNQHGAGSSSFKKMESKDLIGKEKEHIVLQIINIIKLQRKNATILIRLLHLDVGIYTDYHAFLYYHSRI